MMTDLDLVQGILDLGAFGILGFMLLWFMRRNDSHMKRSTEAMNLMAQAIFRWLERTDHMGFQIGDSRWGNEYFDREVDSEDGPNNAIKDQVDALLAR